MQRQRRPWGVVSVPSFQQVGHNGKTAWEAHEAKTAAGDYSPKQNGFSVGRFTVDAIEEAAQAVKLAEAHIRQCRLLWR